MIITNGDINININTLSNWPLIQDLFDRWGHPEITKESEIRVDDLNKVLSELSAWGIPWK